MKSSDCYWTVTSLLRSSWVQLVHSTVPLWAYCCRSQVCMSICVIPKWIQEDSQTCELWRAEEIYCSLFQLWLFINWRSISPRLGVFGLTTFSIKSNYLQEWLNLVQVGPFWIRSGLSYRYVPLSVYAGQVLWQEQINCVLFWSVHATT